MKRAPGSLLAFSLAAAAIAAGCGSGASQPNSTAAAEQVAVTKTVAAATASGPIKVSLNEWRVSPSSSTAKAGKVVFSVTNTGAVAHEMVVVRTAKGADHLAHGEEASEDGAVGEVEDLQPGDTKKLALQLKPGHYALICNQPGHYKSGMHTDFMVD